MKQCVLVYGFGSAFADTETVNDTDLLIVHRTVTPASCSFAIQCKNHLMEHVPRAHVTMLAEVEEARFKFIKVAQATFLGVIHDYAFEDGISEILRAIQSLSKSAEVISVN